MAIVTHITEERAVPHEPGQSFTFRRLGWQALAEAGEARKRASFNDLKAMGGELFQALQTVDRTEQAQAEADPLTFYDRRTLLVAGIKGWSYEFPVNAETIAGLDDETAEWAAREILAISKPSQEQRAEVFFSSTPS